MTDEPFNLESPPCFRGFREDLPVRMYQRRLPHWRQDGATYAVTFRLADSIPQDNLRMLLRWREKWEQSRQQPLNDLDWQELSQQMMRRTERLMDSGFGACVFRQRRCSDLMIKSLLDFQDVRYRTSCFVVMPNHVHLVTKPLAEFELEDGLQRIKQFVATRVNRMIEQSGTLWEEESYDRIIRDEEHLWKVVQYIGRNPRKAGLRREEWVRWIDPEWVALGWGFHDE